MYRVRLLGGASKDLSKMDKPAARRIVGRLHWLAENVKDASLEALAGEFEGLFKLRVGDYRVVYELLREERLILVHALGIDERSIASANLGCSLNKMEKR